MLDRFSNSLRRNVGVPLGVAIAGIAFGCTAGSVAEIKADELVESRAERDTDNLGALPLETRDGKVVRLDVYAPNWEGGELRTSIFTALSMPSLRVALERQDEEITSTGFLKIGLDSTGVIAFGVASANVANSDCGEKVCLPQTTQLSQNAANDIVARCVGGLSEQDQTEATPAIDGAALNIFREVYGIEFGFTRPTTGEHAGIPEEIIGTPSLQDIECQITVGSI
jgi:hypothetical protein